MLDRPPPLSNGFVWIAHTFLASTRVEVLGQRLGDLRHHATTRNMGELGRPDVSEIELWAHPDDQHRAVTILHGLLDG